MKYVKNFTSVGGRLSDGSIFYNQWKYRIVTLKFFMISLFALTSVFITYQLIYYLSLTEYQSEETHSRQLELVNGGPGPGSIGKSGPGVKSSVKPGKVGSPQEKPGVIGAAGGGGHFGRGFNERKKGKPLLSSKIIGVKPSDLHFYQEQGRQLFRCLSTHKEISWEKVNDDYCDCPFDGSDEPSTSACMNGKFYCWRRDGIKDFIPSSRVNDGVCDCFDGTDEHATHVVCNNKLIAGH